MRNLLAFLAATAIAFLGLGWYLDWYSFQSAPTEAGRSFQIEFDGHKIGADVAKGVQQGGEKLHDLLEKKQATQTESPKQTILGMEISKQEG